MLFFWSAPYFIIVSRSSSRISSLLAAVHHQSSCNARNIFCEPTTFSCL